MKKLITPFLYLLQFALVYFSFWESKLWAQNLIAFYYIIGEVLCAAMFALVGLIYSVNKDVCKDFAVKISTERNQVVKYFGVIFYAAVIALFAAQGWFFTASFLSLFWVYRLVMQETFKSWTKENN